MLKLRPPTLEELPELSALMMRSKALWGYSAAFMEACRNELTLTPDHLRTSQICVAYDDNGLIGIAEICLEDDAVDLASLFVDPARKGTGAGRILFEWAIVNAAKSGKSKMTIDADPFAAPFYRHMGAYDVGKTPSPSVPGRFLPRLAYDLETPD